MEINDTDGVSRIFDFQDGAMCHMPYVGYGVDDEVIASCCLKIDGKWKAHAFVDGVWTRVDTGFEKDATECSPFIWQDFDSGDYVMSVVSGGSGFENPGFDLYEVDKLFTGDQRAYRILKSETGYSYKGIPVFARRLGPLCVARGQEAGFDEFKFPDGSAIYRVTCDPFAPWRVIVSWETVLHETKAWVVDTREMRLFDLSVDGGTTPYKPCLFGGLCFHALKAGDDFEDRRIACSRSYRLNEIPFEGNIGYTSGQEA